MRFCWIYDLEEFWRIKIRLSDVVQYSEVIGLYPENEILLTFREVGKTRVSGFELNNHFLETLFSLVSNLPMP